EMAAVFALGLGITLVPNYLHDFQGVSDGAIGFFGSLSAVGSIVLGLLVHRVPALRQPVRAVVLALGAAALALLLVLGGQSLPVFVAAYVLIGGFFATWTLFETALSGVTPAAYRARTYALAELMSGAGISLAPFIAGVLYERDPRAPVLAGLLCILAVAATMVVMQRRDALPAGYVAETG
ncbi:MAG TPA: MFS transporter, partial [Thermomicrobiaceae bacterium]|nr:MFS transporter [Thermomicrobiaceae bacterium]